MPRTISNNQAIQRLTAVSLFLPTVTTPFDQTTAGATADRSDTIVVPATTNASDTDKLFIIGSNGTEINAIDGTVNVTMPLLNKTAFAHPAGTRVLEATEHALGRIEVGGFTISPSQQETLIEAADLITAMQTIKGTLELSFSFGLLNHNAQNFLNALGYADNETGAGTAADKWISTVGDPTSTVLSIIAFKASFLLFTGYTMDVYLTNCSIAPQGAIAMGAKNAASVIPYSGKASYICRHEYI